MNTLQGTIKNGQIILDVPAALPEGTRVEVLPINESRPTLGMREEDWPTTPEGIAALLERMEQVEPGWLSPEDDADWRAALRAQKETEKNDGGVPGKGYGFPDENPLRGGLLRTRGHTWSLWAPRLDKPAEPR